MTTENQLLRDAVFTVLEGFTIPHDVRKILESAYYAALTQPAQPAEGGEAWAKTASELNHFAHTGKWPEDSTAPPASQEQAECVACEGNPAPENNPCAVCGQEQAQQPSGGEVVLYQGRLVLSGHVGPWSDMTKDHYERTQGQPGYEHRALTLATPKPEPRDA